MLVKQWPRVLGKEHLSRYYLNLTSVCHKSRRCIAVEPRLQIKIYSCRITMFADQVQVQHVGRIIALRLVISP